MTHIFKTLSVSAIAILATGCASNYLDDSQKIGVNDSDSYSATNSDATDGLDDKYKVGVNDDDSYESSMDDMTSKDKMKSKDKMDAKGPMVGGAMMYPNRTIVQNASSASNLTTLVAAVKQAELVDTLSSDGPFTVFAPTDTAFSMVDSDTIGMLMKDENREQLQKVLTAHVVSGKIMASDVIKMVNDNGGSYAAQTVSGDTLTFYVMDGDVKVADESGRLATVSQADVKQSNGVVHVVNSVLIPK
ncbi:fasciclin domain-containing protein [Fretibacter rubidus]|uniref:fasciclin domain-containing protein n=1 Tax=Fretibacter rubidus TaxID=570162 RepID=UPI00352A16D6